MRPSFVILLIGSVVADYPYYTDYNNYNSVYATSTASNISSRLHGIKRTWNPDGPFTFGLSTSLDIPLADLGVTLSASLPFSWTFDGATTRVFSGRSLDHRESMFSQIGKHLAQVAGGRSGHGCIQRTICEVAATPGHNDGLFGDIMNVVFSASSCHWGGLAGPPQSRIQGLFGGGDAWSRGWRLFLPGFLLSTLPFLLQMRAEVQHFRSR